MQNLSQGREVHPGSPSRLLELRARHFTFWKFAREVWESQCRRGKLCLVENPWRSEAWMLKPIDGKPGQVSAPVAQCMSGLRDPVSCKYYALVVISPNNGTRVERLMTASGPALRSCAM